MTAQHERKPPGQTEIDITDELLKPEEVEAMLKVARGTSANWRSLKRYPELKYLKIGNVVRYSKKALLEFIEARTIGS